MEATEAKEDPEKQEFFQVEKIVQSKTLKGRKYYLIKWVGYSSKENTWEPIEHLSNVIYMVEEFEQKQEEKNALKNKKAGSSVAGSEKGKKRENKAMDKMLETRDSIDYDDIQKNTDSDIVQRTGPEWTAEALGTYEADAKREGSFSRDEPERIMGVVKQMTGKEWLMKVKWKKDPKTGKRPKNSVYTNTALKKLCPDLLFEFYESNVISNV